MKLLRSGPVVGLLATLSPLAFAESAQSESKGFVEDSSWSLLNRSVFDQREYRHGARNSAARNQFKPTGERSGKAEEWAYGMLGSFTSGFTQGTVGFGLDAHVYAGLKLDSGGGRGGKAGLLGVDGSGRPKTEMSRAGAAIKMRTSKTVLTYGEQRIATPVLGSSDSRLLPETATGLFIRSNELHHLQLLGGRFTGSTDRNATSHHQGFVVKYSNGVQGNSFNFAGAVWDPYPGLRTSFYTSIYEDTWSQRYLGAAFTHSLDSRRSYSVNLHAFRTTDTGKALSGKIDTTTWSLISKYTQGAHSYSVGWQQVDGDSPFDVVTRGAMVITNAAQLSDFNAPNEKSWQARYDLDLGAFGVPGLSLTALYVRGFDIDGSHVDPHGGYAYLAYGKGGKHWERNLEARYVVQSGMAKGTVFSLRHNTHRGNAAQAELDADQLRFAIEYPLGS